jgi:hypothetical protein
MSAAKEFKEAYNQPRGKINLVIMAAFLALAYFASQAPDKPKTIDTTAKLPVEYSELFGNYHINVNKQITHDECATYIIKALNNVSKNVSSIFVFDTTGQVCFSDLKRDSGIVYPKEAFKQ